MKIVLPGGRGQIGGILGRAFARKGHEVVVLSRRPRDDAAFREVLWDAKTPGPWSSEIDGTDVVVNLAGRSVNCRYTARNRARIKDSRITSTLVLGETLAASKNPPRVWLQASTATIYAHTFGEPHDEDGELGGAEPGVPETWRFSIDVARSWEAAADARPLPRTRLVKLRSAMTMSPDRGGVFDTLLGLVRKGLGGKAGDGRQFVSWIHDQDFVRAVEWLLEHEEVDGAVNLAAPHPLPNEEFMRVLREAYRIRWGLPANSWMLELGAVFLRTETELILKSRRVVPGRLLAGGFEFRFPRWPEAAEDLCRRWRAARAERRRSRGSDQRVVGP
jgi:uncharacterized protein (TIGR01777 family)